MSYGKYANPKGGYNEPPTAASTYNGTPTAKPIPIPSKGTEGKFTEKKVYEGVGDFHGNHFRGYFTYINDPTTAQIVAANKHFFDNFCYIFSMSNVATAKNRGYKHQSKQTIEFKLDGTLSEVVKFLPYYNIPFFSTDFFAGILHSDWVSIEQETDRLSCYGSTLKRDWIEKPEFNLFSNLGEIANKIGLKDKMETYELIDNLVEVNQHHFLAGRRSWSVGYDKSVRLWYVETVAFERNSMCEFSLVEKYGDLRSIILDIWINQLNNYFSILKTISGVPAKISGVPAKVNGVLIPEFSDYSYSRNILYKVIKEKFSTNLLNTPWYANVLKRHTGLTKGL